MFEYRAIVEKITDGDTVVLSIDLGFDIRYRHAARLFGINAPEKNTEAGKASKAFLEAILPVGTVCTVRTVKDRQEKFGRILATIDLANGDVVNDVLVQAGHAVTWDGRGARPVTATPEPERTLGGGRAREPAGAQREPVKVAGGVAT